MTMQPEFTPRRGSVSSHYEAPNEPCKPLARIAGGAGTHLAGVGWHFGSTVVGLAAGIIGANIVFNFMPHTDYADMLATNVFVTGAIIGMTCGCVVGLRTILGCGGPALKTLKSHTAIDRKAVATSRCGGATCGDAYSAANSKKRRRL
jgi:hypothetical protein